MTKTFTQEEMKLRAIRRIAEVIYGQWEEGRGMHSRIFEVLVPDEFITKGSSVKGDGYREHVVPCSLIRNYAIKMYDEGDSVEDVAAMIEKHLRIVRISASEARYIDQVLGLKETMPKGWEFGKGDPLARLFAGDIVLA